MIKLEITGDTPLEAMASLTAFGLHCMLDDQVVAAANHILEAEKAKTGKIAVTGNDAPPSVIPAPAVPSVPPVVPYAPPAPPPVVPVAPAPSFTIDQIATAGAALVQAGKMPDLMALLGQFGVQAVTELKPEQLGPFATALRGLGANI